MPGPREPRIGHPLRLSRRAWLAAGAAGWVGVLASGQEPPPGSEDDATIRAQVEERARSAGLGPFRSSRTASYLGIGDAPDSFRTSALQSCETIALDYLDYYQSQGFAVHRPERRLVVVILASRPSFQAYIQSNPPASVVGLYLAKSNALVIYDHRANTDRSRRPRFTNQLTLAHEATHQLTFNTGLLNRLGDVPSCIGEGLAMFGELRKTVGRSAPGMIHQERLRELAYSQRRGNAWIPVEKLLVDDEFLRDHAGEGHSYAQSWLLIHYLLKTPALLPAFRSYLGAIRDRLDARRRLEDARAHLGDLARLDEDVHRYAIKLMKGV
jgi:hypothetical protein